MEARKLIMYYYYFTVTWNNHIYEMKFMKRNSVKQEVATVGGVRRPAGAGGRIQPGSGRLVTAGVIPAGLLL